jgi:hypothetical protein
MLPAEMYSYHDSPTRRDRLARKTDHCRSSGDVYEISELIDEGRIHDPVEPARLLSSERDKGADRVFIYAIDANFRMHVGADGIRGKRDAVKHETLFNNADVRAAGEVDISRGIVSMINDSSGSYGTRGMMDVDPSLAAAIITAFDRAQVPVRRSLLKLLEQKAGR